MLVDADGSLLVIDTGGWYKLCCPTSQLWKPDVLGGIYRVRRNGAPVVDDPRGRKIDWPNLTVKQLWSQLADPRPAVRLRLSEEFASRRDSPEMQQFLAELEGSLLDEVGDAALTRTWALARLETAPAKRLTRRLLQHADPRVQASRAARRQPASRRRGRSATHQAIGQRLTRHSPRRRRSARPHRRPTPPCPHLLAAASKAEDRILQHSITYALIELADPSATQAGLASDQPGTIASALIALDQMPGGSVNRRTSDPALNFAGETPARRRPVVGPTTSAVGRKASRLVS